MANFVEFPESNTILKPPPEMTDEECTSLPVRIGMIGDRVCVGSVWELESDELDEVIKTGKIYLVLIGNTMPPAIVTGIKFLPK